MQDNLYYVITPTTDLILDYLSNKLLIELLTNKFK